MRPSRRPRGASRSGGPFLLADTGSVLLTGGTGFVGRHLLRQLLSAGWRVKLLGRSAPSFLSDNESGRVMFLPCDLADPSTVHRHMERVADASVVVLAGGFVLRSSRPEDDNRVQSLATNVEGTAAILDVLGSRVEWIGYLSTVDVYGASSRQLITEAHETRPLSYYGLSKLAAEGLVRVFARRRGIPHAVLRLAQVYGPEDTSRKAIPAFVRTALAGHEIVVRGPGTERRSYLYVDDAAEACVRALSRRADGTFNIAGELSTVVRAARLAAQLCGLTMPVRRSSGKANPSLALDGAAAQRELGFTARTSLEQGVRQLIEHMRHEMQLVS